MFVAAGLLVYVLMYCLIFMYVDINILHNITKCSVRLNDGDDFFYVTTFNCSLQISAKMFLENFKVKYLTTT